MFTGLRTAFDPAGHRHRTDLNIALGRPATTKDVLASSQISRVGVVRDHQQTGGTVMGGLGGLTGLT